MVHKKKSCMFETTEKIESEIPTEEILTSDRCRYYMYDLRSMVLEATTASGNIAGESVPGEREQWGRSSEDDSEIRHLYCSDGISACSEFVSVQ